MLSQVGRVDSAQPGLPAAQNEAEVNALVVRWMLSTQLQSVLPTPRTEKVTASSAGAQPRKSISLTLPSAVVAGDAAGTASEMAAGSGHLVLVIPQCLELILHPSVAAQLKATAATVVR
jgi:hypothetical protein